MRQLIKEAINISVIQKLLIGKTMKCLAVLGEFKYEYHVKFKIENISKGLRFKVFIEEVVEGLPGENQAKHRWGIDDIKEYRRHLEGWIGSYLKQKMKSYFGLQMTYLDVDLTNLEQVD